MTESITDGGAIDPNGSADDQRTASGSEDQTKDKVAYETYKRTLSEAKKFKSETAELRAKVEQYEQSQLEEQGKYRELNEKLRKEKEEIFRQKKELEASIANERIRSQVDTKARELGCIDTEMLMKAMDVEGLDVVDGYKVSEQSLEMVLNEVKEKKPYLFSKPAPKIHDGTPNTTVDNGVKPIVTSDMSIDDLKKKAMEIDRAEGKTLGWK